MGLPEAFWSRLFGVPRGPIGWVGARLMASTTKSYSRAMSAELDIRSDDELLDVGCGAGGLLAAHAADVRSVAGIDVSVPRFTLENHTILEAFAARAPTLGAPEPSPLEPERLPKHVPGSATVNPVTVHDLSVLASMCLPARLRRDPVGSMVTAVSESAL